MTQEAGDWMLLGSCVDKDPSIWFPESRDDDDERQVVQPAALEEARSICRACPVLKECQSYAVMQRIDHGVWGGLSGRQRRRARRLWRLGTSLEDAIRYVEQNDP